MKTKTYCCGIDYMHEPHESIYWYSTPEELKAERPCWKECGIVEITINEKCEEVGLRWIAKNNILFN